MSTTKEWNRSSSLDPETLGRVNVALQENAQEIAAAFAAKAAEEQTVTVITLSDAQFAELQQSLRTSITDAIRDAVAFVENNSKR
ncbi:MAG TPA: hypothetical protein VNV41_16440 [Candidatus Acidoferrales bacterium]|jgi:hypothetical protein|nr:hypothetical protein [Candidatus Acidoferrales bacterium]